MIRKALAATALLLGIISLPSFLDHYIAFITGQVESIVIQGRWDIAALNIIGFLLFLIPLNYRKKTDWSSLGIYTAFIVSLFIEMYGIPLTVYLTSALSSTGFQPNYIVTFMLLGQSFGMSFWMLTGLIITILGMAIVGIGWFQLYTSEDELVSSGVYSYSRHPQYIGISLVALGWFIGWPTLLTTAMLPLLIYTYYKLCLKEEKEVEKELGQSYAEYMKETPRFL